MSGLTSDQALQLAEQFAAMGDLAEAQAQCAQILANRPDHDGAQRLSASIQLRSGLIAACRINLPARTDRAHRSSRNLAEKGFPEGFAPLLPAIGDEFGAAGRAKSHIAALTEALIRHRSPYCLVLEDDFEFLEPAHVLLGRLAAMQSAGLRWDVLMLGGVDPMPFGQAPLPDLLRVFEASGTVGYVVNRPYIPTLLSCFVEAAVQLDRLREVRPRALVTGRFALDAAWKTLQRRDHWFIANPALGHHRAGHSDIENGFYDYSGVNFYAAL
jgi:hypothetical protein